MLIFCFDHEINRPRSLISRREGSLQFTPDLGSVSTSCMHLFSLDGHGHFVYLVLFDDPSSQA